MIGSSPVAGLDLHCWKSPGYISVLGASGWVEPKLQKFVLKVGICKKELSWALLVFADQRRSRSLVREASLALPAWGFPEPGLCSHLLEP